MRKLAMLSWSKTKYLGLGVLLLAYAMIAGSLYLIGNHTLMWANGISVAGEIVATERMPEDESQISNTSSTPSNAYIVSFIDSHGLKINFRTKFSSSFELYKVGEKKTIIYWPASPENAKILGFMSLYLGPALALLMALVFWLIGMYLFYADKPKWRYVKN